MVTICSHVSPRKRKDWLYHR
ncbi:hypothetical protein Patl1_14904 [Pistacia atlantica]|uniref:Uncharacterized protein n=2 Tax=Pistacia atlantica TaxID=434234 RepID=A0ACC1AXF7_9ROSI|nr:hypothetical protein Patl1_30088 [Pistacia atlantica]KAJ0091348.1 hypothetical protein Patl1_14904 [Pistacia atlantica]